MHWLITTDVSQTWRPSLVSVISGSETFKIENRKESGKGAPGSFKSLYEQLSKVASKFCVNYEVFTVLFDLNRNFIEKAIFMFILETQ